MAGHSLSAAGKGRRLGGMEFEGLRGHRKIEPWFYLENPKDRQRDLSMAYGSSSPPLTPSLLLCFYISFFSNLSLLSRNKELENPLTTASHRPSPPKAWPDTPSQPGKGRRLGGMESGFEGSL
ncbi:hypothetical protein NL676_027895 [Syzygium grande]|nr:hypothetical protein NL676_027895 [Syzygium grande]